MAYRFARALEFTFVPVTILRTINGMEGSLQAFVKQSHFEYSWAEMQDPALRKKISDIIDAPAKQQKKEIYIFDYLIYNTDRHSKNIGLPWLVSTKLDPRMEPGKGSGIVAFDNGAAFQQQSLARGNHPPYRLSTGNPNLKTYLEPKDIHLYRDFFEKVKNNLPEAKIRELMTGTYNEVIIGETIQRRNSIVDFYEKLAAPQSRFQRNWPSLNSI